MKMSTRIMAILAIFGSIATVSAVESIGPQAQDSLPSTKRALLNITPEQKVQIGQCLEEARTQLRLGPWKCGGPSGKSVIEEGGLDKLVENLVRFIKDVDKEMADRDMSAPGKKELICFLPGDEYGQTYDYDTGIIRELVNAIGEKLEEKNIIRNWR
jgi:hypothetical protein